MALVLAVSASRKSTFVKGNASPGQAFPDGDDIIYNVVGIPSEIPDPVHWTEQMRAEHMQAFQQEAGSLNKICIGFSQVAHDIISLIDLPIVVVEIPEGSHRQYVVNRHKHMRVGTNPLPWSFYEQQRMYLRNLATKFNFIIFSNFSEAVDHLHKRIEFVAPKNDMKRIRDQINLHGFVVLRNILPLEKINFLEQTRQGLKESGYKKSDQLYKLSSSSNRRHLNKDTVELFINPHLHAEFSTISVAKSLLLFFNQLLEMPKGQNAHLFNDSIATKTNVHSGCLHWHQDFSFWPLESPNGILVLWTPLCPVDSKNGALWVAVGSHLEKTGPLIQFQTGKPESDDTTPAISIEKYRKVCLDMDPGDAVLFHPNLFHMSLGNETNTSRIAWTSTWAVPWTKMVISRVPTHPKSKKGIEGSVLGSFDW